MKTQLVIALAFFLSTLSFAQKKELKTVEKAIKSGNFADAKSAIKTTEGLISNADDKLKAKFYFLKGQALYADGAGSNSDIDQAIESFGMVQKLEGSSNGKYTSSIADMKDQMLNNFLTKANAALQSKDYASSSSSFDKAYRMSPSDTTYLYYAASTAVSGQDYTTSLKYYEELRDLGYKGITTEYTAVNKESGVIEGFDNKSLRDLSVRAGTHITPKDKKTESKSAEIVKNIALIHLNQGNDEKAIEAMKLAREQNPEDLGLLISEANVQLKMGNKERFKELMQEATLKDPNNAELQYNLGVIAAEAGEKEAAMTYYEKAIELNPSYTDAYNNIAVLILADEGAIVEEMNGLGNSSADNKRYDDLRAKRTVIFETAIPYLETVVKMKPKDIQAAQTLMNIYRGNGQTDKYKEMKAKVGMLESGN